MCWHEGQSTGMDFCTIPLYPQGVWFFVCILYFTVFQSTMKFVVYWANISYLPSPPNQRMKKRRLPLPHTMGLVADCSYPRALRLGISHTPPLTSPPPRTGSLNSYVCRCSKLFTMVIFCLHVLTWGPVHRHGFFVPYLCTLEGYIFLYVFCTLRYFSPLWS